MPGRRRHRLTHVETVKGPVPVDIKDIKAGDHIVAARAMFGSCLYIVQDLCPRFGITYTLVDGRDTQAWAKAVAGGKKTRDELLAMVQTKGPLTEDQLQRLDAAIEKAKPIDATTTNSTTGEIVMTYAQVADRLNKADNADKLAEAGSLIATVADEAQRKELTVLYDKRAAELNPA